DALDDLALLVAEEERARALAGDRQHARLVLLPLARHFGGAARPGDALRPGAFGKVHAGDLVPRAEQHRVDAGAARQNGVDEAVRHFADLDDAAPGRPGIHNLAPVRENIPAFAARDLEDRGALGQL